MSKAEITNVFGYHERTWVWCLHCQRAYQVGEYREKDDLQYCPYLDCDGDSVVDAWPWKRIKEIHPNYPDIPEKDKVYPLY
jgi:hypothetical protein